MAERTQWVFTQLCGCPIGVLEGSEADSEVAAMVEMYEDLPALRTAVEDGIDVQRVSHQRYVDKFLSMMDFPHRCPHGGA